MGLLQQQLGAAFEKDVSVSMDAYRETKIAFLDFLPPPIRPVVWQKAHKGSAPLFTLVGQAPFDVHGYLSNGIMIGVELKATQKHHDRIKIVSPVTKGSGVQYHQLDALAHLSRHGGIAGIVWSNGGEVGVMNGQKIVAALNEYEASMKGGGKRGSKSLEWSAFEEPRYHAFGGAITYDWLPLVLK